MKPFAFFCLAPIALVLSPAAHAATLSSKAAAASTSLSIGNVVAAAATLAPAAGTAGADYDVKGGVAKIDQSFTLFSGPFLSGAERLSAGVVATGASGTATSASATASLKDASATFSTTALGALPLAAIGIAAKEITSTTTVGIGANGLTASGGSTIAGLAFSGSLLGNLGLDLSLYANADANTMVTLLPGLTITFNEQIVQNLAGSLAMSTNAIHLAFDDFAFGGRALSGDLILGHSEASIAGAVPEPASWAMMVGGFGLLGALTRRRRTASFTYA